LANVGKETDTTKLDLPEQLKRLAESVPVIRADVKDVAISIVLKVAEKTNTFLDVHFILNHTIAAQIWQEYEDYHVALYLDNGVVIDAVIGRYAMYIDIRSIHVCNNECVCESR